MRVVVRTSGRRLLRLRMITDLYVVWTKLFRALSSVVIETCQAHGSARNTASELHVAVYSTQNPRWCFAVADLR